MPSKIMDFWHDLSGKTGQIGAIAVAAVMVLAAVSGMVLLSSEVSAATYDYTEGFEDESTGGAIRPDESWYTYGGIDVEVTSDDAHAGSNSLNITGYDPGEKYFELNTTGAADVEYFQFYFKENPSGNQKVPIILWDGANDTPLMVMQLGDGTNHTTIYYKTQDGTITDSSWVFDDSMWYAINISLNYTDDTVQYQFYNGSWHELSWQALYHSDTDDFSGISVINIGSAPYNSNIYFDDLQVGSNTDLGDDGSGDDTPPGAPSFDSANTGNYTVNFTATGSISGFDGSTRLTFPEASVNDTAGDVVWSNETSYGTITLTNDGTNQVNISWTKGTGADNTVVEVDTSDHATWNVGDGMEIYNDTGTSTVFDYNDDGAVTFSEETTYYIALFGYNASGYSDAATTSVTSNNVSIDTVNIHIEDIGSGDNVIPRENLTVYEVGSTSGGWTFDAGTGNVSISSASGLPLAPGDSAVDFVVLQATVGSGVADGTYNDGGATSLDCSVEIQHNA